MYKNKINSSSVGLAIEYVRTKKKLTQKELGSLIGCFNQRQISRMELLGSMNFLTILKLCDICEITILDFTVIVQQFSDGRLNYEHIKKLKFYCPERNKISSVLRDLRMNIGLSVTQVAEHFQITYQSVYYWENGKPPVQKLNDLLQLYDTDQKEFERLIAS